MCDQRCAWHRLTQPAVSAARPFREHRDREIKVETAERRPNRLAIGRASPDRESIEMANHPAEYRRVERLALCHQQDLAPDSGADDRWIEK